MPVFLHQRLRLSKRGVIVLGIGFLLALVFTTIGSAQTATYDAVVTCDDIGYTVTLVPDWGRDYVYDFSNLPVSVTRRRTILTMAPSTDPMSETWENIGGPIAQVNFSAHWIQQTRQLLPEPGAYVTEVDEYILFNLTIDRANCTSSTGSSCKPQYFMYTFQDANQPDSWQPYCYIISNNGFPSVERQAQICTVPGFDHTYRATSTPYAGWVYLCNGDPHYGWPNWNPAWYRPEFAGK